MNAETIATALDGRRAGAGWIARCPAHDDHTPSLSVGDGDNGRILLHCFAGCSFDQVVAVLRARGLWTENRSIRFTRFSTPRITSGRQSDATDAKRTKAALPIWHDSVPPNGTLLETYLQSRGILLLPPPILRFHAGLRHPSGVILPAMVAVVTRGTDDAPIAIHRTFIASDGRGKAPVTPNRMMLGPCRGGAVRLAEPGDVLMIGEGIETVLSAMQSTGYPAWAALSTSGLRALDLPGNVCDVIVLADADGPGEAAAQACARRWKREGRRVRIARPPRGNDFNDTLKGGDQ